MKLPAVLTAAVCGAALLAGAQPQSTQPRRDRSAGVQPGRTEAKQRARPKPEPKQALPRARARQAETKFERFLDERQRAELREIMAQNRERAQAMEEKAARLRRELGELIWSDNVDQERVKELADGLARLQTERLMLRAKSLARLRSSLSPEQRERLQKWVQRQMDARPAGRAGEAFRAPQERRREAPESRDLAPRPGRPLRELPEQNLRRPSPPARERYGLGPRWGYGRPWQELPPPAQPPWERGYRRANPDVQPRAQGSPAPKTYWRRGPGWRWAPPADRQAPGGRWRETPPLQRER
jgi:Spy/CpxP family protein refolding chaperone